jgi:hypothetical protein
VINAMCDNLLLTAFALETKFVTAAMVDEVAADMRLQRPGQKPFRADGSYPDVWRAGLRSVGEWLTFSQKNPANPGNIVSPPPN